MTKRMDGMCCCARCTTQPFNGEMTSGPLTQGPVLHHDRIAGSHGLYSSQSFQGERNNTNLSAIGLYQSSPPQNGPWHLSSSFERLPNIGSLENDFDTGDPARYGDMNNFLRFSTSPDFVSPQNSRYTVSQDRLEDLEPIFVNERLSPDIGGYVTPNPPLPAQSRSADGWCENHPWTDGLSMPSHGRFHLEHGGLSNESCENAGGRMMTYEPDDASMHYPPSTPEGISMPPSILTQYHSSEASWSRLGTPSSSAGQRLESGPRWDMEARTHNVEMPLLPLLHDDAETELLLSPCSPSSAVGDHNPLHVPVRSSAPLQVQIPLRRVRKILARPSVFPFGVIEKTESNIGVRGVARKVGKRHGPLTPKIREGAYRVRKVRACANCRIKKIRCSEGVVCGPCLQSSSRRTFQWPGCFRKFLDQYIDVFCPDVLFEHLEKRAIKSWIEASGIVNVNNEIFVQVSSGLFPRTMFLKVREIFVPNQDALLLPDVNSSNDEDQKYATTQTLQYALHECEVDQVKPKCLEYISALSNYSLEDAEDVIGDTPKIIWKSLETIYCLLKANSTARRNGLLQKALKVYWIQYALSRTFTLNSQSAIIAIERLQNPSAVLPSQQDISARVLNRQLKGALKLLYEEHLTDLLQSLEKEYRSQSRMSWLLCFCTNLILCLVVEQLQNAIDGLIPFNISEKGEDPVSAVRKGTRSCQELEDLPIKYSWTMFFGLYKSYNPIKNGWSSDDNSSQSQGEAEFIAAFSQLIRDNEIEMLKKAADPCPGGTSQTAAHHKAFRARNSARHLSKFLVKFIHQ